MAFASLAIVSLAACGGGGTAVAPVPFPSTSAPTTSPAATATPIPTASPTPTPSATPAATPTATPTPTPTASPTVAPSPTPSASATPHTTTQTVDAGGHAYTDSNAFIFGQVGPYGASIGYPANDSNVVSATSTAYQGPAPGAPVPSSGTVVYSITTTLSGGPPSNQMALSFFGSSSVNEGVVNVPSASSGTYSLNGYVPAYYGSTPIYTASGLTQTNGQLMFGSPFSSGSTITLPTGTTVYFELSQP